ncbi:MAG TPA: DUF2173 family protein [Sulfuriferula sp.]|nr:DUF2173 family protein [Sulfuriferula sp.]
MSRSSELLKLPGVMAAGLFSRKGLLEEFEGPFPEVEAEAMASLCSSIAHTMEMQGLLLDRLANKSGWESCYGWAMWGPEMCIASVRDSMCIMHLQKASFDEVISAMRQSAGVEENSPE